VRTCRRGSAATPDNVQGCKTAGGMGCRAHHSSGCPGLRQGGVQEAGWSSRARAPCSCVMHGPRPRVGAGGQLRSAHGLGVAGQGQALGQLASGYDCVGFVVASLRAWCSTSSAPEQTVPAPHEVGTGLSLRAAAAVLSGAP